MKKSYILARFLAFYLLVSMCLAVTPAAQVSATTGADAAVTPATQVSATTGADAAVTPAAQVLASTGADAAAVTAEHASSKMNADTADVSDTTATQVVLSETVEIETDTVTYQESEEPDDALTALDSSASNTTNKKIVVSNSNFSTVVNCGLNGCVTYDTATVVEITVTCEEDFTGSIRLLPSTENDSWLTVVAYEQDITLVAGEAKTFTFYPSSLGDTGKIKIQILDEKGKEIYSETDSVTMSYMGENLMIGVLSDDFAALNYFNGLYIANDSFYGFTQLMELNADNFPEKYSVLSMLDYIIIDNFDTAQLSEAQYEALQDWVEGGGVLILGLGDNYQNVLHIFNDDFVTGTIGSLQETAVVWPNLPSEKVTSSDEPVDGYVSYSAYGVIIGATESVSLDGVNCLDFSLDDGEVMRIFAEGNAAYRKSVGAGTVVVLSYDLAMEPMVSFSQAEEMAYALLLTAVDSDLSTRPSYSYSYDYYDDYGETIASLTDSTERPSVRMMAVILILYVIIVGPVLYLILRAIGKREKIWLAIPGTAVVFTLVIFIFTLSYQIGSPIVNTFSMIALSDNAQEEMVYVSVTCPQAKEYELLLNEDYTDLQYDLYSWDYSYFDLDTNSGNDYDMLLEETNEGLKLVLENDEVFNETNFAASRTSENSVGSLDLNLTCYTNGFEGTVTNHTNYDLMNVVVYFEDYYVLIDELAQGETAAIEYGDQQVFAGYYYSTFNTYYYNYTEEEQDEYLAAYSLQMMEENYLINSYNQGGVWAFIADYAVDVCADASLEETGCAVIYDYFTADYADVTGAYYADISTVMASYSGDYDPYDNMLYTETFEAVYQFEEDDNIISLTNKYYGAPHSTSEPDYDWTETLYAKVYAYNVSTGDYEEIFTDSETIEGDELKKYMDENNQLKLRYVVDPADLYDIYIPIISALGGETDAAD